MGTRVIRWLDTESLLRASFFGYDLIRLFSRFVLPLDTSRSFLLVFAMVVVERHASNEAVFFERGFGINLD